MSLDNVSQMQNPSNPSGVSSRYQQSRTAASYNFNAATTSTGLADVVRSTPVNSRGLSASTVPNAMPTATRSSAAAAPANVYFIQLPYHRLTLPRVMYMRRSTLLESRTHWMVTTRSDR
jgi:hypothetical protein